MVIQDNWMMQGGSPHRGVAHHLDMFVVFSWDLTIVFCFLAFSDLSINSGVFMCVVSVFFFVLATCHCPEFISIELRKDTIITPCTVAGDISRILCFIVAVYLGWWSCGLRLNSVPGVLTWSRSKTHGFKVFQFMPLARWKWQFPLFPLPSGHVTCSMLNITMLCLGEFSISYYFNGHFQ